MTSKVIAKKGSKMFLEARYQHGQWHLRSIVVSPSMRVRPLNAWHLIDHAESVACAACQS